MDSFDINQRLGHAYASFPEAPHKPVVGITGNFADGEARLAQPYYRQVVEAGGVPLVIPPCSDTGVIINTLQGLDALLLSGGSDYNPLWCGQEPLPQLHGINAERDAAELLITTLAYRRNIPILGICRGIQTLAMALKGEVAQDIDRHRMQHGMPPTEVKHSQDARRQEPTHTVAILPGSTLHTLYNSDRMAVNSLHHQAVSAPGPLFKVTARAADGVIEAIESAEHRPVMGVQWHPEWLGDEGRKLFDWLIGEARIYHHAVQLHQKTITLDSHCDTPMLFPKGVSFSRRDPRILVDMHKMAEGRLDAVTMAAYLPQPKPGSAFAGTVGMDGSAPLEYAENIFSKIEGIVNDNSQYLALARTPAQVAHNKAMGKRSIMLAVENGLALEGDIRNIERLSRRGVVYVTLCHNGDNDICDSASRTLSTHNGVSPLGRKVIEEMNRLGVMVDMSHAGERSFFDAIDISKAPIVCSHSNCRALCDHPRNLTDEQLKAIARKGGVAQTTFYNGFLNANASEAGVLDAISHLNHAVSVMGIEHVGIGSDFDGDGGVCGLADASDMLLFTMHLLRRRYTDADLALIWGGNWLRVMQEVQRH